MDGKDFDVAKMPLLEELMLVFQCSMMKNISFTTAMRAGEGFNVLCCDCAPWLATAILP